MFVRVSLWLELVCVIAEYRQVVITMPDVGYAYNAFRKVRAFVPVLIGRGVRHRKRYCRSPAKTRNFFDE